MEQFTFQKVTRFQAKLRLALQGVSGSGKTLGALYIAYGMTGDWGKVALIDTEHERGRFYANREDLGTGEFLYAPLYAPYSPERYKSIVAAAAQAVGSNGVVIVDSFSHAWNAEGGVLDIKEKISNRAGKNSYTAWAEAGKEQSSLVNTILAVPCHTIVTMRSKMEYALEVDERGKQKPVKIGLAPVQREDTEYEFDVVLSIDRDHIAVAQKDTTFLDKYGAIITPELGYKLKSWLDSGAAAPVPAVSAEMISRKEQEELFATVHRVLGETAGNIFIKNFLAEHGYQKTSQLTQQDYADICIAVVEESKKQTEQTRYDDIPQPVSAKEPNYDEYEAQEIMNGDRM